MSGRIRAVFWPRFSVSQPKQKLSQRIARAFDLDENTLRGIQDPAAQLQFSGQAIHERPKTHSLHCAAHDHSSSFMERRSHPVNLSHAVRGGGFKLDRAVFGGAPRQARKESRNLATKGE